MGMLRWREGGRREEGERGRGRVHARRLEREREGRESEWRLLLSTAAYVSRLAFRRRPAGACFFPFACARVSRTPLFPAHTHHPWLAQGYPAHAGPVREGDKLIWGDSSGETKSNSERW